MNQDHDDGTHRLFLPKWKRAVVSPQEQSSLWGKPLFYFLFPSVAKSLDRVGSVVLAELGSAAC